jgi:16S rRNA (guanine527-N7)-methyltransferase
MILPELFDLWQETLQWQPNEVIQARFQQLYDLILEGNQRFNLTRITQPEEFWEKHLWDSLSGLAWLQKSHPDLLTKSLSVIDLGTGAGFPGVPIAIAYSLWSITLLDSTQKKINFLEEVAVQLQLNNTKTCLGRAETIGKSQKHNSAYDIVCLRAVANADLCVNYALPFLKVGGTAILYRGQWSAADTINLEETVQLLGGKILEIASFKTPLSHGVRHCLYISKQVETLNRTVKLKPKSD